MHLIYNPPLSESKPQPSHLSTRNHRKPFVNPPPDLDKARPPSPAFHRSSASVLDDDSSYAAFTHRDYAVDEQRPLAAELGREAVVEEDAAEVCEANVADVDWLCDGSCCGRDGGREDVEDEGNFFFPPSCWIAVVVVVVRVMVMVRVRVVGIIIIIIIVVVAIFGRNIGARLELLLLSVPPVFGFLKAGDAANDVYDAEAADGLPL